MNSYRANAAPPRSLDFRAVSLSSTVGKLVTSAVLFGYVAFFALSPRPTHPVPTANTVFLYTVLGAALFVGAILLWKALAGSTTRLRFRIEGESVVIAWHRWGRLVRTQVVPRSFIERGLVEESLGHTNPFRLVIATSSGTITFEGVGFGSREDYAKQATMLSDFLDLEPVRIDVAAADAHARPSDDQAELEEDGDEKRASGSRS